MATAKITLIGMYNFDNSLFDGMDLPEGIDKDTFIASLLLRDGEFEVLYPDFTFLKGAIAIWSNKWRHTFEKWLIAQAAEWNPIENYDRYEEFDDSHSKNLTSTSTESKTNSESQTSTGSASGSDTTNGSGSNEAQKSAYDSGSYQPDARNLTSNSNTATSSSSTNASSSTNGSHKIDGSVTDVETGSNKHTAHIHGNIGVTTSASMLKEFRDVNEWNLYDHMADLFKTELLIPIY